MEIRWYLLFVRSHWEKKVAQILTRKKIENYCPLNESVENRKIIGHPLIPSFIFVRVSQEQHSSLKKLSGIINFAYWLGEPAIIQDTEIKVIKRFLSEYSNVTLEKISVNLTETGKILNHSFTEQEGHVISFENKTIKAILPSIGYALVAECEPSKVRVIASSKKRISGTNFIRRIRTASKQLASYY